MQLEKDCTEITSAMRPGRRDPMVCRSRSNGTDAPHARVDSGRSLTSMATILTVYLLLVMHVVVVAVEEANHVGTIEVQPAIDGPSSNTDGAFVEAKADLDHLRAAYALAQSAPQPKWCAEYGCGTWGMRGLPYLWETFRSLLTVKVVGDDTAQTNHNGGHSGYVLIYDTAASPTCQSKAIDIWVRIGGEHLVSGLAEPLLNGKCSWRFRFTNLPRGSYLVDVKVLTVSMDQVENWNRKDCMIQSGYGVAHGEILERVAGLKMYDPDGACCEICTSRPACRLWARVNRTDDVAFAIKERSFDCILYKHGKLVENHMSGVVAEAAGLRYQGALRRFIGCGWDITTAMQPCVDDGMDDMPHNGRHFPIAVTTSPPPQDRSSLPMCTEWGVSVGEAGSGRWVRSTSSLKCTYKPTTNHGRFRTKVPTTAHQADEKEECWMWDNLSTVAGIDVAASATLYRSSIWKTGPESRTPASAVFGTPGVPDFRYEWQPEGCRLKLFTDSDMHQCLNKLPTLSIAPISGQSIASYLQSYLNTRLAVFHGTSLLGLPTEKEPPRSDIRRVVQFSTLAMVHRTWHMSDLEWLIFLDELPRSNANITYVYVHGPLVTSQREEHITETRRRYFKAVAMPTFKAKGWKVIDWTEISAALAFDMAVQADGLHVAGSPMKVAVNIMLNVLCEP